jgi:hypothetical protein
MITIRTTKRFECIDPERNHKKLYELSVKMLRSSEASTIDK